MKGNRNTLPMHYEREGERNERARERERENARERERERERNKKNVVCNICTYKFQVKYLIFLQTI